VLFSAADEMAILCSLPKFADIEQSC